MASMGFPKIRSMSLASPRAEDNLNDEKLDGKKHGKSNGNWVLCGFIGTCASSKPYTKA